MAEIETAAAWKALQEMVAEAQDEVVGAVATDSPDGFLTRTDQWAVEHSAAAMGMTKAAIAALDALPTRGPFALVASILETAAAFKAAESDGPDRLLAVQPAPIVESSMGSSRWTLLTAMSDRIATVEALLGPMAPRPHYRKTPPAVTIDIMEVDHPERLPEALGVPLRQVLEASEDPSPAAQARRLFASSVDKLSADDVAVGTALHWLLTNDGAALMTMPIAEPIRAALLGEPSEAVSAQFAHVIELGPLGYGVFIWWDPAAGAGRAVRGQLAGYIRYLYDHYVAPWNRWTDQRSRREALCVYGAIASEQALEARRLSGRLREMFPSDYAGEPWEKTIRRLYRRSNDLSNIYVPPSLRPAA
jgi:hypothetical protein